MSCLSGHGARLRALSLVDGKTRRYTEVEMGVDEAVDSKAELKRMYIHQGWGLR